MAAAVAIQLRSWQSSFMRRSDNLLMAKLAQIDAFVESPAFAQLTEAERDEVGEELRGVGA